MSNNETVHDCPDCPGTKLICDLKKGGGFYECPKCGSCYARDEFLLALNQGRAPGKMSSAPKAAEEPKQENGEAKPKKKREGKSMSKKGTCVKCSGENLTIVARGLCWKCYDEARGKTKPAKSGTAKRAVSVKPVKKEKPGLIELGTFGEGPAGQAGILLDVVKKKKIKVSFDIDMDFRISDLKAVEG